MPTRCNKIKLKTGSEKKVSDWAAELNRRSEDVITTLVAEGVTLEAAFLDHQADGDYLIYVMHADDFDKAHATEKSSTAPIDLYHKAFKEACWEERTKLENLIDFKTNQQT